MMIHGTIENSERKVYMSSRIDLTGLKFGRWTVIKKVESRKRNDGKTESQYLCRCDCGNEKIIAGKCLSDGSSKSCGCYRSEFQSKRMQSHGMSNTRIYHEWDSMKNRCFNKRPGTESWNGKGIKVCEEWMGKTGFKNFYKWAINNGYSDQLTLDRIDNNKDYSPENCRWADYIIQNNNSSNNVMIEYHGEIKTIAQWAKEYGINYQTLYSRIKRGYEIGNALNKSP